MKKQLDDISQGCSDDVLVDISRPKISPSKGIHWHGIFVIHETATEESRGQHHTQDFKLIKEDPMHGGCKRRRIRGEKDASPRGNYQRKRAGSKNDAVVKEISANNKED
ncbi:hypothetical protein OS493_001865 [Desmophyllum pertusum]|uniref:Uncharacterized protein n=1 Tax=Desmophyllum pertusum TaxID=174260 RepID=A0A9W9Z4Y1_9CNID|nr:hypothetical protein OS493_001865 [Desmophyllum pertusum]